MKPEGRILLFTGDGKGKTTAALGTAFRAAGHGIKTLVLQFVKAAPHTGEIDACRFLPCIEIVQMGRGFVPDRSLPAFAEHRKAAQAALDLAQKAILSGQHEMIVLDEICTAVSKGMIDESSVIEIIKQAGPDVCLVLTGRGATAGLIAIADTATEMRALKHGYAEGIAAQKGVEY